MDAQLRAEPHALVLLLTRARRASRAARPEAVILPDAARAAALLAALLAFPSGPAAAQEPSPRRPSVDPEVRADAAALRESLSRLLEDPALRRAHVGLLVQIAGTGEVLFAHAAEKRFTAASVTKLVTGAVALHRLGAAYRWRTRLVATGPIRAGALLGDLWIVGGGDPTLKADRLDRWAASLRRAGVVRIDGDVVADDRVFDRVPWGRGWMWDDAYTGWGAGVSGLHLHPGRIPAELTPASEVGGRAAMRLLEPGPSPGLRNAVRTGAPGSEIRLRFRPAVEDGEVLLEGWIPLDEERVPLLLAPSHPTGYLLERVALRLEEAGITVGGRFRQAEDDEPAPVGEWSAETVSDSLGAVLQVLLKRSDNQIAETLLRTLGVELGRGGSADDGLEVVEATLAEWGIEPGAVALADGSGLSRYGELTPAAVVRLLRRTWQLPEFAVYREALPIAGVDGTLSARLLGTAGERNVRAKTGSLSGVRGLAGYLSDGDGETLVFALLLNGYDAPGEVATALEDLLVEQLALYHGPRRPARP